jgi:hypothetical protein
MASTAINITGNVANVAEADAQRLAAFVLRCNQIIISTPVLADGSFRLTLSRATVKSESAYGLTLAVAPATAGMHLEHLPNIPKIALNIALRPFPFLRKS